MYELLKCITQRERKEEEHALLPNIIIIFINFITLLILTRDLKRGKEVLNNKKVSIMLTIPEGIFISLFVYSLTRFLFSFFPRSRNRSRVRPRCRLVIVVVRSPFNFRPRTHTSTCLTSMLLVNLAVSTACVLEHPVSSGYALQLSSVRSVVLATSSAPSSVARGGFVVQVHTSSR